MKALLFGRERVCVGDRKRLGEFRFRVPFASRSPCDDGSHTTSAIVRFYPVFLLHATGFHMCLARLEDFGGTFSVCSPFLGVAHNTDTHTPSQNRERERRWQHQQSTQKGAQLTEWRTRMCCGIGMRACLRSAGGMGVYSEQSMHAQSSLSSLSANLLEGVFSRHCKTDEISTKPQLRHPLFPAAHTLTHRPT